MGDISKLADENGHLCHEGTPSPKNVKVIPGAIRSHPDMAAARGDCADFMPPRCVFDHLFIVLDEETHIEIMREP